MTELDGLHPGDPVVIKRGEELYVKSVKHVYLDTIEVFETGVFSKDGVFLRGQLYDSFWVSVRKLKDGESVNKIKKENKKREAIYQLFSMDTKGYRLSEDDINKITGLCKDIVENS